ncbi:polysaccharide deacetylase family protein [Glutamicibacter uratoxydans]|uniref:polysaccharide deacetylase family protein n=1 Tax=Glutamicibacter uratoxydans TaxID=43667 RepID=UPI003D6F86B5
MSRALSRTLALAATTATILALVVGCSSQPETQMSIEPVTDKSTDCQQVACVALTFDDGPSQYTDEVLDKLAQAQAPGTFFVLGKNVSKYPETLQRMVSEGHQIGSHGFAHKDITTLTREEIEHEVQWSAEAIQEAAGVNPTVFRPPYGAHGAVYNRLIPTPLLLWDVDTLDWSHHDPAQTVEIALDEVQTGSVILLHDIHESSVAAVPELIQKLRDQGYVLVTVDELFAHTDFTAGAVYTKLDTSAGANRTP